MTMTVHYTLVFALLITEMLACTVLLLPLPYTLRRWLLSQITSGRVAAQLQYTLRVLFLLVAVLLLDALHRAGVVASVRSASAVDSTGAGMLHSHNHADMLMRRFYAQRNVYLCGFTLFLAFVLNRLVVVVAELVGLEGRLRDASASASPILGASTSVPATDEKQDTSTASNADMDMVELKSSKNQATVDEALRRRHGTPAADVDGASSTDAKLANKKQE